MPQLDFTFFFNSAIILFVCYITLLFIMETYIVPKLVEVLKFRHKLKTYGPDQALHQKRQRLLEGKRSSLKAFTTFIEKENKFLENVTQ